MRLVGKLAREAIGVELRDARTHATPPCTQAEMASVIGTTQSHVSRIERGVCVLDIDTFFLWSDRCGLPVGVLAESIECVLVGATEGRHAE